MKSLIRTLGLAGLITIGSISQSLAFSHPAYKSDFVKNYGELMFFRPTPSGAIIGYDTDGDKVEDLRMVYQIAGQSSNGSYLLELKRILSDKNRDKDFSEDEIIWEADNTKKIPI